MLSVVAGFTWKEIAQTFRYPGTRLLLFYIPALQLILYGLSLSNYTQDVSLAVISRPDDGPARRLAQRFYASGWFVPAPGARAGDPVEWLQTARAEAVLIAPPDSPVRASRRKRAPFQLLIDSVNTSRARSIEHYAQAIIEQNERDERRAPGDPPVRFVTRTVFNPERETAIYLIPGTLCFVVFLAMTGLTNMSIARERETGTIETLYSSPISAWELLLGKTLPFVIIGMAQFHVGLLAARAMGVPVRGPLWAVSLATLVFLCCSVTVGFFVAMRVRNQQQALFAAFIYGYPMTQLSGVVFPVENIPESIRWLAYFNPLHYYVDVMRHLLLKGFDAAAVLPKLAAMGAIGLVAAAVVMATLRQTMD